MFRQHEPEEIFLSLNFFTSVLLKITPVPHLSAPPPSCKKKKKEDQNVDQSGGRIGVQNTG